MVKTDSDVIIEQFVRNNGGVLAVSNEEKSIVLQSHHDKFLISFDFAWIGIVCFRLESQARR